MSAGPIRAAVELEIRTMEDHMHWRCRAVTVDPKNTNRIRIACRDEAEHQLVKKVAEAKIGAGARVLRDELYPIKVDSFNKAAVLDEKDEIRAEAAAAFSEENEATVAKIAWLSRKESGKAIRRQQLLSSLTDFCPKKGRRKLQGNACRLFIDLLTS